MLDQSNRPSSFLFHETQVQQNQLIIYSNNQMSLKSAENIIQEIKINAESMNNNHTFKETKIVIIQSVKKQNFDQNDEDIEEIDLKMNIQKSKIPGQTGLIKDNNQYEEIQQPKSSSSIVFQSDQYEYEQNPQSSKRKLFNTIKQQRQSKKALEKTSKVVLPQLSHEIETYEEYQSQEQEDEIQQPLNQMIRYNKKIKIQSRNMYDLINYQVPNKNMIKAVIKIQNQSIFSLKRTFHFFLTEEKRLIMSATKPRFHLSSKYEIISKSKEPLGKVQSNYSRSQYKLSVVKNFPQMKEESQTNFSSTILKLKTVQSSQEHQINYKEKCYLSYGTNIFKLSQQKVEILQEKKTLKPTERFSDLRSALENHETDFYNRFSNKMAQKDANGFLTLDFKDKNVIESTKNMIIQNDFGQACLVFGKYQDNLYIVNAFHPFSLIEAFFIGISHLDRKILIK